MTSRAKTAAAGPSAGAASEALRKSEKKPTFDAWIVTLEEDVVEGEYGYEPGEFTVYPGHWRPMWVEGLTPSQAFKRACEAATIARREDDEARQRNWERIQAQDRAAIQKAKAGERS